MDSSKDVLERLVKKHGSIYRVSKITGIAQIVLHKILDGRTQQALESTYIKLMEADRDD